MRFWNETENKFLVQHRLMILFNAICTKKHNFIILNVISKKSKLDFSAANNSAKEIRGLNADN